MKSKMYLSKLLKLLVLGLIFNSAFAEIPSKEELKKMNVFMSNFFEAGIRDIDIDTRIDKVVNSYVALKESKDGP